MKFVVVTKYDISTVEAEDLYEAVQNLPWREGYEPLAIVKAEDGE